MVSLSFKDITGYEIPGKLTVFLWILGISAMVALSVKDLRPIFTNYFDIDSNVNVLIDKIENETIRTPDPYVCLAASQNQFVNRIIDYGRQEKSGGNFGNYSTCPECQGLKNHGWNVWSDLDLNEDNETLREKIYLAFIQKILSNSSDVDDALFSNHSDWNQPIVESMLMLISTVNGHDSKMLKAKLDSNGTDHIHPLEADWSDYQIDFVYDQLIRHVKRMLVIRTGHSCDEEEGVVMDGQHILHSSLVVWAGSQAFCFHARNLSDFSVQVDKPYFKYGITWSSFFVYTCNPMDDCTPLYQSTNNFDNHPGAPPHESVKLTYSIQSNVKEERPGKHCYQQASKSDCLKECRIRKIIDLCSCFPFTRRSLLSEMGQTTTNLTYCTLNDYKKCRNEYLEEIQDCDTECTTACEHVFYQWQIIVSNKEKTAPEFKVQIKSSVSPFLEFTLAVKDNKENLISQVGGIFNFYLGWSGLSIVICAAYLIDCYRRWRRVRKAEEEHGEVENGLAHEKGDIHIENTRWQCLQKTTVADCGQGQRMESKNSSINLQNRVDMLEKAMHGMAIEVSELKKLLT